MRTQYIKIRNIPEAERKRATTIRVKPWVGLYVLLVVSLIMVFMKSYFMVLSASVVILTLFALMILPDRILVQFMQDYMILYNRTDRDECTMIYYDEVVSWHYEYHRNSDLVVVDILNGDSETFDMFSKRIIKRYMNRYMPNKEKKARL